MRFLLLGITPLFSFQGISYTLQWSILTWNVFIPFLSSTVCIQRSIYLMLFTSRSKKSGCAFKLHIKYCKYAEKLIVMELQEMHNHSTEKVRVSLFFLLFSYLFFVSDKVLIRQDPPEVAFLWFIFYKLICRYLC